MNPNQLPRLIRIFILKHQFAAKKANLQYFPIIKMHIPNLLYLKCVKITSSLVIKTCCTLYKEFLFIYWQTQFYTPWKRACFIFSVRSVISFLSIIHIISSHTFDSKEICHQNILFCLLSFVQNIAINFEFTLTSSSNSDHYLLYRLMFQTSSKTPDVYKL